MAPVQVLIVTFEHEHEIGSCLDAVAAQAGVEIAVTVADNASSDGTLAVLDGRAEPLTVLARTHNDGYAAGVNATFAAAGDQGDVLLLNPDVRMDPDCVATLVAHLDARPSCGAVAALLREPDGTLQRFAVRDLDAALIFFTFTHVGQRLDGRRGGRADARRHYEELWSRGITEPVAVDCPAAACVLVRRSALPSPPMDPDLPLFFNDADLWRRIRGDGWEVEVCPGAGAVHDGGTSIRRADPVRIRAEWVVATRRYVAAHGGPLRRGVVSAIFLADVIAGAWLLASRQGTAATATSLRGTLGGLGLPGGPSPWLTPVRRLIPERITRTIRKARRIDA
jgi:GT2 family glycosyltransferase